LTHFQQGAEHSSVAAFPSFPGLDAQRQAIEHGVRVSGATVHLVTAELDGGPIILQSAVPVLDDGHARHARSALLIEEHRIYPEAIRVVLEGKWTGCGASIIDGPNEKPRS